LTTLQRPFGVTLLAALHVLQAIFFFLGGIALWALRAFSRTMFRFPRHGGLLSIIGLVLIIIALLDLGFAWGLWNGKGWAWILALIFAALGILVSLISLVRGGLWSILVLVIDVVILYYLTRPNVRAFFGEAKAPTASTQPMPQASTASSAGARFCPNCGAPVAMSEKFCAHCGAKLL
jgi:uncharacterized membrane protein (DUF2068 family)